MGREYVIQSWVKHDADDWRNIPDHLVDESAGYSGEQVGNRAVRSNGNTRIRGAVPGYLPSGKADIAGAADPADDAKGDPLLLVDPAFKVLLDYPGKVATLEKAFNDGRLPEHLYKSALRVLDVKADKAQRKIDKLIGHVLIEEEDQPEQEPEFYSVPLEEHQIPEYQPTPEEAAQALKDFINCDV